MTAALKQEIIDLFRVGGAQIPDIASFFGISEAQVEKTIFPNGRQRKLLPAVLPKIAKDITTLYGADGVIRIPGKISKLVPLSESKMKIVHRERPVGNSVKESDNRAGHTPSKAKTPEGRLGALKAWETMRKQKAEKNGEVYIPRTLDELKRLAGIHEDKTSESKTKQEELPISLSPDLKSTIEESKQLSGQESIVKKSQSEQRTPIVVPTAKDDDLDIDYKPVVEMGRVVDAYCKQHGITFKELLESHQQLMLITKLVHKPN